MRIRPSLWLILSRFRTKTALSLSLLKKALLATSVERDAIFFEETFLDPPKKDAPLLGLSSQIQHPVGERSFLGGSRKVSSKKTTVEPRMSVLLKGPSSKGSKGGLFLCEIHLLSHKGCRLTCLGLSPKTVVLMETLENTQDSLRLESSWKQVLRDEFEQDYMKNLRKFLASEIKSKKTIYPKPQEYFAAFEHTPIHRVRVVILGQDPYHGPDQAHGLCFSVRKGVVPPPSLKNIFKEIHSDLKLPIPQHGCLTKWADQGVLLLNSVLTVEAGLAASHRNKGWEQLTDRVIREVNNQDGPIVFLLWGSYAQNKAQFVDRKKHLVLESVHPSPLSAHRGFLGCKHFSQANAFLKKKGLAPIDWSLD